MGGEADPPAMQGTSGQVAGSQYLIESKAMKFDASGGYFFQA
jgi:hypothetical protein